jgi:hypothetical protein
MHTHQKSSDAVATIGIDIGKNTFHLVGLDKRGAIAPRYLAASGNQRSGMAERTSRLCSSS